MPRVSFIVATYNRAKLLPEAIDSALAQSVSDIEVRVVDDGSTDGTREVLEQYRTDPRVFVVHQRNQGAAAARNRAIRDARGAWLAVLDSDDLSYPERLRHQLQLGRSSNVVLVTSGFEHITANREVTARYVRPGEGHASMLKRLRTLNGFPAHSTVLYRASAIKQVGGFDVRYPNSQDADLIYRMAEVGKLAHVPRLLAGIRVAEPGLSNVEGGRRQLLYGLVACVAHFLRDFGRQNPGEYDTDRWNQFVETVDELATTKGYFRRRMRWQGLSSFARLKHLATAAHFGGRGRAARGDLSDLLFGSKLPEEIARHICGETLVR